MPGNLQPLDQSFPIVTSDGRPTLYFIKWAQQRQIDIGEGISGEQALQIIQQYLADHKLQAGTGINISPSGDISDSPAISADAQAILDQISNEHGSVLFRGAAAWEALAPGTADYFLKTNGADADPEWAEGGGGGGGGGSPWELIRRYDNSVDGNVQNIVVNVSDYDEIMVYGIGVTLSASSWRRLEVSTDGGATFPAVTGNWVRYSDTGTVAQNEDTMYLHSTAAATARFLYGHLMGIRMNNAPKKGMAASTDGFRYMFTPLAPITHIRVSSQNGTALFTGGNIYVVGRKASGGGGGWTPSTPAAIDFPIVKTGTGMVAPVIANTAVGQGVTMQFWRNSTASNWRQAYFLKTVPAGPFRAEALIVNPQQSLDNWHMAGIAMGCSGDVNKHIRCGDLMDANFRFPYTTKNTGLNTSEVNLATIFQPNNTINYGQNQKWVALEYDGANIHAYASLDGYTWWKAATEPATFFLAAPDQIGFGWEAVASDGGTQYVWCRHFKVTTNLADPFGLNA